MEIERFGSYHVNFLNYCITILLYVMYCSLHSVPLLWSFLGAPSWWDFSGPSEYGCVMTCSTIIINKYERYSLRYGVTSECK